MTLDDLAELDPLRFVTNALDERPEAEALSADAWDVLTATGVGLERLVVEIGAQIAALEYRVCHGLPDIAGERAMLEGLAELGVAARRRLSTFTAAAARAHGINLAGDGD